MRPRVALRHGLSPVTKVITKKGTGVQMHSLDEDSENIYEADVPLESWREDPILDASTEKYDLEITREV